MSECICKGNWRNIVKESEPLLYKIFLDDKGLAYNFIGVLHSSDDYYYCMLSMTGELRRLSCVCSLDTYGFELADKRELT